MRAQKVAQDVDVLTQQVTRLTGTLKLLDRELALTRKLFEQKVVPEIEMLRLDRQADRMPGQLPKLNQKMPKYGGLFFVRRPMNLCKIEGISLSWTKISKSAQDRVRADGSEGAGAWHRQQVNVTTSAR